MSEKRPRLSIEQLREEDVFLDLTPRQKILIETYVTSNYDRVLAVQKAYNPKTAEIARTMSYEVFATVRVIACLACFFQDEPLKTFQDTVRRAYRQKKLTTAQVSALELLAKVSGWGVALPGVIHGRKAEPDEPAVENSKAPAAPVAASAPVVVPPKAKPFIGQIVPKRRPDGTSYDVLIVAIDPATGRTKSMEVPADLSSEQRAILIADTIATAAQASAPPPAPVTAAVAPPIMPDFGGDVRAQVLWKFEHMPDEPIAPLVSAELVDDSNNFPLGSS